MTYAKYLAKQFQQISELEQGFIMLPPAMIRRLMKAPSTLPKKLGANQEAIEKYILPNTERYSDRFRDYRLDASKHGIERNLHLAHLNPMWMNY